MIEKQEPRDRRLTTKAGRNEREHREDLAARDGLGVTQAEDRRRDLRGAIAFAFGLAALGYLAWVLRAELLLIYVSALAAVVFTPVVRATSRVRVGRWRPFKGRAIFILVLAAVGCLTAFGFLALPPIIRDLNEAAKEMPARFPAFLERLKSLPFADRLNTNAVNEKVQDVVSNTATYLLLSIKNWAGAIFSIAMGVILTLYFILEGDIAYRWVLSFFPVEKRARLDAALARADVRMGKWLLGQGSLMLILGLSSTIVYSVLHVRYAYALGVLTGLLNIIPVAGAAGSIALALIVAAVDSWGRVIGVAIFYVIWVQVENSFLIPRIMGTTVGLPGTIDPGCAADRLATRRDPRRDCLGPYRGAGFGPGGRIPDPEGTGGGGRRRADRR